MAKVTKKTPNVNWFKNVAKSLGYTSSEMITQMMPSTGEFFSVNREFAREASQDFRELRNQGRRFGRTFTAGTQIDIGKQALKNAISDIKSGKIYNRERVDRESMNFGDDFDFGDSGSGSSPKIVVNNVGSDNSSMLSAMQKQTESVYRSAEIQNSTNVTLATNKMVLDQKHNTRIVQGLQTINDNIAMLVNFQSDSMTKYIGASIKYYEESLTAMNQTLEELKRGNGALNQPEKKKDFDPVDEAFLSQGGLNIKGYMNVVKRNMKETIENNPLLSQLSWLASDKDVLKSMAASPLSFISTKIVSTLIPQFLKQSFGNFDKSFSNFFPAMFMKLAKHTTGSDNPLLQGIGSILGINVKQKSTIDLSRYHKGPTPFDGKAHKAITEVIPGYLRKILSALTGNEDVAYDYNQGQFRTVKSMKQDFDRQKRYQATSSFDGIQNLKDRSNAFVFENRKDREDFNKRIDTFFEMASKREGLINPRIRRGRDGDIIDDLKDTYDFEDPNMLRIFRQLILSSSKKDQMQMFGRDALNSKRNVRKFMLNAENNPDQFNANTLFNGLNGAADEKGKIGSTKGIIPGMRDKFNFTALDYLRDIKRILLQGIRVFGTSADDSLANGVLTGHQHALKGMKKHQDRIQRDKNKEEQVIHDSYTEEQKKRLQEQGRVVKGSTLDLYDMTDSQISSVISGYDEVEGSKKKPRKGIGQWIGSFLKGDTQEKYNLMREKIDQLLSKPADLLRGVFDKIDNTMYTMVFGKSEDDTSTSFLTKTMAMMKNQFSKMGAWLNVKILEPLKENLFGKEGIITKLKDSDMFKNMKTRMKSIGDFMFGKADADGKRNGGLFTDTANNLADMWDGMKYYFNGKGFTNRAGKTFADNKENSVFGEVKKIFSGFKENMKQYLMGKKDKDGEVKEKGMLGGALDSLKEGFRNFGIGIFGPRGFKGKDASQTFGEMTKKIKAGAPKALSWGLIGGGAGLFSGSLGLLGSLFLPGGPVGGAIVGTTLGFLSQSERFKSWMFGNKDADGQRLGGVISKSTQEFFKKHKVAIIGGAGFGIVKGMVSGLGLLPSFFLPGGPVGGAIMGIGASLLFRSEMFQKMLFGPKGEDGKRTGGIIAKAFGQNKTFKNLMGNVGAGAISGLGIGAVASHLGIMGAMLVPGGPIGGAILGAAAGIALSSDRWKKALFGEWDEETGLRKGGMLGKFQNWFKLEVQEPMKLKLQEINLNIKEWFTKSIANPFIDAIAPMKKAFTDMFSKMQDMFQKGWDSFKVKIGDVFEKNVGLPFGKFMEEKVMKPLKGFLSKIINGVGKVFGTLLSSPFKALSAVAVGVQQRQEQKGVRRYIDDGWNDMGDFRGRRERGERMGLFRTKDSEGNVVGKGVFGRINDMYFNKETRQNAREGEHGASYAAEERERIAKRNAEQDASMSEARAALASKRDRLAMHRKLGLKYDYENFDENGMNISKIYNIYQKISKEGVMDGTGRKLADKLGLSPEALLGEGADMNNLSKAQKKKLSNAIKRGLRGANLKSLFEEPKKEEEASGDGAEEVTDSVNEMSDKLTEEVQESNKHLDKIHNAVDKIVRALGLHHNEPKTRINGSNTPSIVNNFKSKMTDFLNREKQNGSKHTIVRMAAGTKFTIKGKSHASGIDNVPHDNYAANLHQGEMVIPAKEANYIRKIFGAAAVPESSVQGPVNSSNRIVNGMSASVERKGSPLSLMVTYLRSIAASVHGQLDGVGSNVYKIRKIIQSGYGIQDADIKGSANKDRVGFIGKLKNIFFKPFDLIREKIAQGIHFVTDKIVAFGTGIANVTKAILSIPVNIAKGVWEFTKNLGTIAKETAISIAKIPLQLAKMATSAIQAGVEVIKMAGPAIAESLMGVAKVFSGALTGVSHAMIGFGKGVGNLFTKLGKGVGDVITQTAIMTTKVLGSVGKLLTNSVSMITDFTFKMTQTILDGTLRTLNTVGKKLMDVGETMLQMVTSPLKFFAQSIGSMLGKKQEVYIKGGQLDSVTTVQVVERLNTSQGPNTLVDDIVKAIRKASPITVHMEGGQPASPIADMGPIGSLAGGAAGGKGFGGGLLSALEGFATKKDKIDQNRVRIADQTKKLNEKSAHTNRKTATFQLAGIKAAEKEQFTINSTNRQISLLERIANTTTEQKDNWLSIFGKKGLITMAALFALPFLKKLYDMVSNFFNKDDRPVPNQDLAEHAIRGGAKIAQVGVNAVKRGIGAVKSEVKTVTTASKTMAKAGISVGRGIAKTTSAIANSKAGQAIIQSKPVQKTISAAETAAKNAKSGLTKVTQFIKDLFEKIFNTKAIVDILGIETSRKAKAALAEDMITIIGRSAKKSVPRILGGIAVGIGKTAAAAGTFMLSEGAWAVWNGVTGAIDAAHLFKVDGDQVDWKMRSISSVIKMILGFGWNFIFAIINDIAIEFTGKDFVQMIATRIYQSWSDDADYKSLLNAQTKFADDAKQAGVTTDVWNDMQNKTVGGKIADGAANVWNATKKGAGKVWDVTKSAYKLQNKIIGTVANEAQYVVNKTADGIKWAGGKVKDGAVWAGNKMKDNWNRTGGAIYKSFTDDEQIKKNFNVTGDGTITTGMRASSGAAKFANVMSFGLLDTEATTKFLYKMGIKVQKFIKGVGTAIDKNFIQPITKTWNKVSGVVSDAAEAIWKGTTEIWNNITNNIKEGWKKTLGEIVAVGVIITDVTKKLWNGMSNSISEKWNTLVGNVKNVAGIIGDFTSKTWDKVSNNVKWLWNKVVGVVSTVTKPIVETATFVWNKISGTIGSAWKKISSYVGTVGKKIGNIAVKAWDGIKTTAGKIWDGISESINKVLKPIKDTATKVWETLKKSISETWDSIVQSWEEFKGSIKGFFKNIKNFFTGDDEDVDKALEQNGFTPNPKPANGGMGGRLDEGGMGGEPTIVNGFKYYSQKDDRWKNYNYGYSAGVGGKANDPSLGYRGCGPTSMAMVASQLTGNEYLPTQMADLGRSGGYSISAGTSWSYFPAMAKKFGLKTQPFTPSSNSGTLLSSLQKGVPVILSGKRTQYAAADSPFTTGGHFVVATGVKGNQIIINDPRGASYSKGYDISKVLQEARQGWTFTRGDGSVPPPSPAGLSSSGGTVATDGSGDGTFDAFSKMNENFALLVENMYGGTNKSLSWGDAAAQAAATATGSSAFGLNFVPKTIREKILKKTLEMTIGSESGGKYYYARNDISSKTRQRLSPSIGILQWREGNAKRLMEKMYSKMPNDPEAKYYATQVNWGNRAPWSAAEQQKLENFLKKNDSVSKDVQNQYALEYINGTNLGPVYKYGVDTGKIKDPRSIAMLAEFANTGPGNVQKFLANYNKTNGPEFEHFLSEFKSKSIWGRNSIYSSRIKNVTAKLQNWDPEQGGYGGDNGISIAGCGGFGGEDIEIPPVKLSAPKINRVSTTDLQGSEVPKEYRDSYNTIVQRTQPMYVNTSSGSNDNLLGKVIQVLQEIAAHTGGTSQGIQDLSKRDINVHVDSQEGTSKNGIIVVNGGGSGGGNVVQNITNTQTPTQNRNHTNAKKIMSGRR
ncbi:hypothetical protein D1872_37490 [compost metagenome]